MWFVQRKKTHEFMFSTKISCMPNDGDVARLGSLACPQVVETLLDSMCAKGAWPYPAQILESPVLW
jgi:hypothetical protein